MTRGRLATAALAAALSLLCAAPAGAEVREVVMRHGPYTVGPYQVKYTQKEEKRVAAPDVDGYITRMHARVVDEQGQPLPVQRMMLHHVVYKNAGRFDGEKRDPVCGGNSESFYGTGEENQTMRLPPGFGYPVRRGDRWQTGYMLMNHRSQVDRAYIEYRMTIDTDPSLKPVTPYWLRVTGCPTPRTIDPIFDVPGNRRRGSTYRKAVTWRMPEGALLLAAGGHSHGGSKDLTITQPRCGGRALMPSRPTYGMPDHPYYNVLPVLHEPGPIDMSWVQTARGIPVGKGERLKLASFYDGELPHTRVMGIMHLYAHHDPAIRSSCGPLPSDLTNTRIDYAGRSEPPRVRVPLTGIGRDGQARTISRPPGRRRRAKGDVTVQVRDFAFSLKNLAVPLGSSVSWRFHDRAPHNVTLASGPLGFSSYNLGRGRRYSRKLTRPGTYRLFCSLHPVSMSQSIVVRRRRR